jgi:hypothetical protein
MISPSCRMPVGSSEGPRGTSDSESSLLSAEVAPATLKSGFGVTSGSAATRTRTRSCARRAVCGPIAGKSWSGDRAGKSGLGPRLRGPRTAPCRPIAGAPGRRPGARLCTRRALAIPRRARAWPGGGSHWWWARWHACSPLAAAHATRFSSVLMRGMLPVRPCALRLAPGGAPMASSVHGRGGPRRAAGRCQGWRRP